MPEAATNISELKSQVPAERKKATTFPAMLSAFKGEIERALPQHLNADRICRIALTAFRQNPTLARCDPRSIFACVIQSSQLGLEIGLMGEAHLVPFKSASGYECQLIPGYQGLIKLAKQTGQVVDIYPVTVWSADQFELVQGTKRELKHRPASDKMGFPLPAAQRGEIVGFYAVAVFKDGSSSFEVMGRADVEAIRDKSSSGYKNAVKNGKKDNPWIAHFEAMGKKTVLRALCKYLPKSPELAYAVAIDERGGQKMELGDALAGDYIVVDEPQPEESKETQEQQPSDNPTGVAATSADGTGNSGLE